MRRQASARTRPHARTRTRTQRAAARRREHRLRRFALLTLVATVAVVTLALTAFGNSPDRAASVAPAPAVRLLPVGKPQPAVLATLGDLQLQLPIDARAVTAIGFHGGGPGALALAPAGRQANEGLLARLGRKLFGGASGGPVWYQISGGDGPRTSGIDVGAAIGTPVYSPVDGRVVGLTPYILDGRQFGTQIDIQPLRAPSLVVSLTHVKAPKSLSVGTTVTASETRLGTVADLSGVEQQELAHYTNDSGNHAEIEVRPAATLPFG